MARFSERYGYVKVSDVIVRETMTEEIKNSICNCYDSLKISLYELYRGYGNGFEYFYELEIYLWKYFFNEKESTYHKDRVIIPFVTNNMKFWYEKFDIIEETIIFLNEYYPRTASTFVHELNSEFQRHNYAYRIVNYQVVEITSKEEIDSVESAINESEDSVKHHLQKALELYAKKPEGDYQNSIKESITAVEALSRKITGENTLNFKKMEDVGVMLPASLRGAFEKLYGYTNDKTTGIRHALMDEVNKPQKEEALFMLVTCSAFINYVNTKQENQ